MKYENIERAVAMRRNSIRFPDQVPHNLAASRIPELVKAKDHSSTSSTRAVKSRFTGAELGVDVGSAEVVVAVGVTAWAGVSVMADLDFLPFFLL